MSHHTCVEYQGKMYLFGGSSVNGENLNLYSLDLHSWRWNILKPKAANGNAENMLTTRDEHSCVIHNDSMLVFGGFAFGERSNSIYRYNFRMNIWELIKSKGSACPCPRAGHSAVLRYNQEEGDCMYIFGGKDEDNIKLSDTWKFNLTTLEWTQIEASGEPLGRSGHASQVYNDCMIIYGGIFEVTKELNDMHVFNFKKQQWEVLFEELNSPQKPKNASGSGPSPNSVGLKKSITMGGKTNFESSPKKTGKDLTGNQRISTAAKDKERKPKIQLTPIGANKVDDRVIKLESPTSITMKNSFLIKNADPSFEKCYA